MEDRIAAAKEEVIAMKRNLEELSSSTPGADDVSKPLCALFVVQSFMVVSHGCLARTAPRPPSTSCS